MSSLNMVDGIEKIHYAVYDPTANTYGTVKLFSDKVTEFGLSPKQNSKAIYASNSEQKRLNGALTGDLSITVLTLDTDVEIETMGKERAVEGGKIDKGADKPYIALMVEKTLDDGAMEYLTIYKGQLANVDDKAKTKDADGNDVEAISITGSFSQRKDKLFKWAVRSTDADFSATTFSSKWGKEVILPTKKTETAPTTP
jgi:phi13 family phage major tail protein